MSKTLFDVMLPATGRHYDFWVPDDLPLQEVAQLISQAMQVAEPAYYQHAPDVALMYQASGQMQDPAGTAAEMGFTDGDCFVLV